MDYEHVPFKCRRCHEYSYLFKQCPLNNVEEKSSKKEEDKRRTEDTKGGEEGFQEIPRKIRPGKESIRMQLPVKTMPVECQKKFKVLQEEEWDMEK